MDESAVDALAALTFLEREDVTEYGPSKTNGVTSTPSPPASPPRINEPGQQQAPSPPPTQYKSSFAPSKNAVERKARSQAQQAAHDAAVHKPGRPNGKPNANQAAARGWNESSDEEDEEDEDEDGSSDDEPRAASASRTGHGQVPPATSERGNIMSQAGALSSRTSVNDTTYQPQQRPLRSLPQIPPTRSQGGKHEVLLLFILGFL